MSSSSSPPVSPRKPVPVKASAGDVRGTAVVNALMADLHPRSREIILRIMGFVAPQERQRRFIKYNVDHLIEAEANLQSAKLRWRFWQCIAFDTKGIEEQPVSTLSTLATNAYMTHEDTIALMLENPGSQEYMDVAYVTLLETAPDKDVWFDDDADVEDARFKRNVDLVERLFPLVTDDTQSNIVLEDTVPHMLLVLAHLANSPLSPIYPGMSMLYKNRMFLDELVKPLGEGTDKNCATYLTRLLQTFSASDQRDELFIAFHVRGTLDTLVSAGNIAAVKILTATCRPNDVSTESIVSRTVISNHALAKDMREVLRAWLQNASRNAESDAVVKRRGRLLQRRRAEEEEEEDDDEDAADDYGDQCEEGEEEEEEENDDGEGGVLFADDYSSVDGEDAGLDNDEIEEAEERVSRKRKAQSFFLDEAVQAGDEDDEEDEEEEDEHGGFIDDGDIEETNGKREDAHFVVAASAHQKKIRPGPTKRLHIDDYFLTSRGDESQPEDSNDEDGWLSAKPKSARAVVPRPPPPTTVVVSTDEEEEEDEADLIDNDAVLF